MTDSWMSDPQPLLDRQAEWQKTRKALSWPEKIRMAERIRESVLRFRRGAPPKKPDQAETDPR
jgi:hypothetical protein